MTTSYTYKLIEAASKTWYQTESVFPGIQDNYSLNNCSNFFFTDSLNIVFELLWLVYTPNIIKLQKIL